MSIEQAGWYPWRDFPVLEAPKVLLGLPRIGAPLAPLIGWSLPPSCLLVWGTAKAEETNSPKSARFWDFILNEGKECVQGWDLDMGASSQEPRSHPRYI